MADISIFRNDLRSWLEAIWLRRATLRPRTRIQDRELARRLGVLEIYKMYAGAKLSRDPSDGFFRERIESLCQRVRREQSAEMHVMVQSNSRRPLRDAEDWAEKFILFYPPDYRAPHQGGSRTLCRLYVNLNDPIQLTGPWVMEQMYEFKYCQPSRTRVAGLLKGKIAPPRMASGRLDIAVFYCSDYRARLAFALWLLHADKGVIVRGALPPGIQRFADGIGFADEPPPLDPVDPVRRLSLSPSGAHSFGSFLAAIFYHAIESVGFETCRDLSRFLDEVEIEMSVRGIDPAQPQLIRGGLG